MIVGWLCKGVVGVCKRCGVYLVVSFGVNLNRKKDFVCCGSIEMEVEERNGLLIRR